MSAAVLFALINLIIACIIGLVVGGIIGLMLRLPWNARIAALDLAVAAVAGSCHRWRSALSSGPSGTGKSHLAIAIAYRAIQHGYEARFVGADALMGELSRAAGKGRLEAALELYLHPHVLVVDELGYLSHAPDAANVLYRVINERYLPETDALDHERTAGRPGRRAA